jgi:hypothetical protein
MDIKKQILAAAEYGYFGSKHFEAILYWLSGCIQTLLKSLCTQLRYWLARLFQYLIMVFGTFSPPGMPDLS